MKQSNLLKVIISLSHAERRLLKKFVNSPVHNPRQDVKSLMEFILGNLTNNFKLLTKEEAFAHVFQQDNYDGQKIRYCMSATMKVVEKFLVWNELRQKPLEEQLYLTKAYRRLGLVKMVGRSLAIGKELREKMRVRDSDSYESDFNWEMETYFFSLSKKRTAARNLEEIDRFIDLAYLAKKLRQSCTALSHGTLANIDYDSTMLNHVLAYLPQVDWLEKHPIISLYFYGYKAATTGKVSYFEHFRDGMIKKANLLPMVELRRFYFMAINFCIKRYNKGDGEYLNEVFELYKKGLAHEVLLENGILSRFSFTNISGIAIKLKEFEWTENFIEEYSQFIEWKHRKNYRNFVLAKLRYAKGELGAAMHLIQNVEYEDVFLSLDAKVLLLKIYFELGETEVLDSFISSFQRFLNRKKELGYHRENYTNTLLFARRILTVNTYDKTEKDNLRKEIESVQTLGEREWLLGRLI